MDHLKDISTILYLKVPYETFRKGKGCFPRAVIGLEGKTLRELTTSATRSISLMPNHVIDTRGSNTDGVLRAIFELLR